MKRGEGQIPKYRTVEVTEKQLEDLIRQQAGLIEEGLRFIDHQRTTDRGPLDVLMVDSGNTLVVAELKVVEDDTILVQGIDYYDYVHRNIEGFSRVYKSFQVQPTNSPRLLLMAPSFSVNLLNRCKWIDIPLSLFTFKCIQLPDKEVLPVFTEVSIPLKPEVVEKVTTEDHLNYITDPEVRQIAQGLLEEIQDWDNSIAIEPTKYYVSIKVSGRVFTYLSTRRKHFIISCWDNQDKWGDFPIRQKDDLPNIKALIRSNYEYFKP